MNVQELPYDPERVCEKCGFDRSNDEVKSFWQGAQERIERTCLRCKYVWRELPLDHDPELEERRFARQAEELRLRNTEIQKMLGYKPSVRFFPSRDDRVAEAWEHIRSIAEQT